MGRNTRQIRAEWQAKAPGVVTFTLTDPIEGDSARGDYVGAWGGAVLPLLSWTTRREEIEP